MNRTLRNLLYAGARGLGLLPWLRRLGQGPVALFYHGVAEHVSDPAVQGLHLPLELFARQARFLREQFQVISLEELAAGLATGRGLDPRQALITFDDGYRNLASLAAPLLHSLGLPFAVFINTQFVEEGQRLPTYLLRVVLAQPELKALDLPSQGRRLSLGQGQERAQAALQLGGLLKSAPQAAVRALAADLRAALPPERWGELDQRFASDAPLTWAEVRSLQELGATIGSHGHEHAILHAAQPEAELRLQLARSRELIKDRLGLDCRYLAYPNGRAQDACPLARRLAAELGYGLAFTTIPGQLRPGLDPLLLPRLPAPGQDTPGSRELDIALSRRWGLDRAYAQALASAK